MAIVNETNGGVTINVNVRPRAGRCRVAGSSGDRLRVEVSAPPEGGKATKQVLATVASALGVKESQTDLLIGKRDRRKTIRILGITVAEAERALGLE